MSDEDVAADVGSNPEEIQISSEHEGFPGNEIDVSLSGSLAPLVTINQLEAVSSVEHSLASFEDFSRNPNPSTLLPQNAIKDVVLAQPQQFLSREFAIPTTEVIALERICRPSLPCPVRPASFHRANVIETPPSKSIEIIRYDIISDIEMQVLQADLVNVDASINHKEKESEIFNEYDSGLKSIIYHTRVLQLVHPLLLRYHCSNDCCSGGSLAPYVFHLRKPIHVSQHWC